MTPHINFETINHLTLGRIGKFDVPCPLCGPYRKQRNQKLKTLRVWRKNPEWAGYCCAHCGEQGHARDGNTKPPSPIELQRIRAEADVSERAAIIERRDRAQWLWGQSLPINGSIAERYLREARRYAGPLPATLRFLPARDEFQPALIAAFCIPDEPEPGLLTVNRDCIVGVQLTRLAPDGSGKAGTDADKNTIGKFTGVPIVLAPVNDLLGLAIAEGIEDALSVHQANGLGSWACGGASRLPAIADAIPDYVEAVTIMVDNDQDGERKAGELEQRLAMRGIEITSIRLVGLQ
jgi:hypothetical protein